MMKKIFMTCTAMTVLLAVAAGAQTADELQWEDVNVAYTYTAPSEGKYKDDVDQSEVKLGSKVRVLNMDEAGFDLSVGVFGQVNYWSFDDSRLDDLDLYKVEIPVAAKFQATDEIPVTATLRPGVHSDFDALSGDDLWLSGSVVGEYLYQEDLTFVLGLGVGEDFGDVQAFPIVGARWQATDAIMANLVFPRPKVTYTVSEDLKLFVAGEPTGGQWNVSHQTRTDYDLEQEGYRVGLGGEYQVMDGGWLYAMAGHEGNRSLQIAVDDDTVLGAGGEDLDDAIFVQIGFRMN